MDKQYLNDEFNRFFEFTNEDKSQVSSVSAKLFAEHIAYPRERELEKQAEEITTLRQRVAELEKERDSAYKIADHYRDERDALMKQRDELLAAAEQVCHANNLTEAQIAVRVLNTTIASVKEK